MNAGNDNTKNNMSYREEIRIAIKNNEYEALKRLLQHAQNNLKIDFNYSSQDDLSPLHCALEVNNVLAAEMLFKYFEVDINVNIPSENKLPTIYAHDKGYEEMFSLLQKHPTFEGKKTEHTSSVQTAFYQSNKKSDTSQVIIKEL